MSLKKKAAQVRAKGTKNVGEDSVLAHISPKEAMLLKARGGSGREDPDTGLLHFDENGDGGAGGSMGSGGIDAGNGGMGGGWGGGWADAGGFTGAGLGSMGGYQGYDPGTPDAGAPTGGWAGLGFGDLANGMGFNGYDMGLGFGDQDMGGFTDVGGFASPAQATGWNNAMSAQDSMTDSVFNEGNARKGLGLAGSLLGGLPGMGINMGLAATSKDPGKGFGSMAGGLIGGLLGGPVGAFAGSQLGGRGLSGVGASTSDAAAGIAAGNAAGNSGATSTDFDLGGVLTGLAGLYQGGKASDNSSQAANMAQSQAQSLADMYGPNSPYAQQLRQQLERKDAAGGRRSQYGPREVELQARLADIAARNAPNVLNANKQAYEMRGATNKTGGQQLAGLMSLANKTGLTGYAQKGLESLWDSIGSSGGATNGLAGFSEGGQAFNNPSAYTAPESGGNFWDSWL